MKAINKKSQLQYIPHTKEDVSEMLKAIGCGSIDDLFVDISSKYKPKSFNLPEGISEFDVMKYLRNLAQKNKGPLKCFLGGGFYDHYIPEAANYLASRGEFLTAYTPYQPECSQGTLQALYEFQSVICSLTGMEVANASLYEGGTALYEAVMMAIRITKRKKVVIDSGVNPIYRKILSSYTTNLEYHFEESEVVHGQSDRDKITKLLDKDTAVLVLQNPNFFGAIDDHSDLIEKAHELGVLVVESVYPISLGLLKSPGEIDADIVVGDGQSMGHPLQLGGPYLGFMATKGKFIRKMPGRVVGQTVDRSGKQCFVNTIQAREQHIRREKATSNICTNSALCAIQSLIYLSLLGKQGLKELAQVNLDKAEYAKVSLEKIPGIEVKRSSPTFNEFTIKLPVDTHKIIGEMIDRGFIAGFPLGRYYKDMSQYMIIAVTEQRTKEDIDEYVGNLKEIL